MSIVVENTSELGRLVTIEFDESEIASKIEKKCEELASSKSLKIEGFRSGKVSPRIVKQRFGSQIREEVIFDEMKERLFKALDEKKIVPAAMPEVTPYDQGPGKPVKFTASFEVYPELNSFVTKGEIEAPVTEVTEADIEKHINTMLEQFASWEEVNRASQKGDKIRITGQATVEDKPFPGSELHKHELELGKGGYLEGFEDSLVGVKTGEEKTFTVHLPEGYAGEFSNKDAVFTIKMDAVLAKTLPELNEDIFNKLDLKDKTKAGLEAQVKKYLTVNAKNMMSFVFKQRLFAKMLELNPFAVPASAIKQEQHHLQQQAMENLKRMFGNQVAKLPSLPLSYYKTEAQRRVALGILLSSFVETYELKVDDARREAMLDDVTLQYDDQEEAKKHFRQNKNRMAEIDSIALEDVVADKMIELGVKVTKKPENYEELTQAYNELKQQANHLDEDDHEHHEGCGHDHHHDHVHGEHCDHDH